jgi:selenocysteine lyase/cysteine desulfurase
MSVLSQAEIREIRREFPALQRYVYLATNGLGLLPRRAAAAARKLLAQLMREGIVYEIFRARERVAEVRRQIAAFLGAPPEQLAFSRNTTEGILWFAHSFPWQPGDEVLAVQGSYPAAVLPFLARRCEGVRVRFVRERQRRLLPEDVAAAWGPTTRALALSWVQFHSGFRADLKRIVQVVRQRGGVVVCDAVQGLGLLPFSASEAGADLVSAGAQKWLLGPPGIGVVLLAPRLLSLLHPHHVGCGSLQLEHDPEDPAAPYDERYVTEARRFEEGMRNWLGLEMLAASVSLLAEIGSEAIAAYVHAWTEELLTRLRPLGWTLESPRGKDEWSGILLLRPPPGETAEAWMHRLHDHHIAINQREGCLHLGVHVYNDESDLDALVAALRAR